MSGYAILGATGQVGGSVLKALLERSNSQSKENPNQSIRVLVRSQAKFEKQLQRPNFSSLDHSSVEVVESADISKVDKLVECIANTRAVFLCVAAVNNQPGCSVSQDAVNAVISALRHIHDDPQYRGKLPRLVILSSAEAEEVPHLSANIPWPMRSVLFSANSNIYNDLIAAEKILRKERDWIDFTIVKPGGLSWDVAKGHKLSFDEQQTFISYADMVNGMIEVADEESSRYEGRNVSVLVPSGGAKAAYENAPLLFKGLLVHFFPFLYSWLF